MAEADTVDRSLAVASRALVALAAVVAYLGARTVLDPAALAAARFGLGILLFALLVDLGRSIAGTGRPLRGALGLHRQRARPQVDEAYDELRSAVREYVDEGRLSPTLLDRVHQAGDARGLDEASRRRLDLLLREARAPSGPTRALLGVRLLAGLVVTIGVGLAAASLAESLGIVLVPPVLLVTGTSLTMLQWRALEAGATKTGLLVGLTGLSLFGLGAVRYWTASTLAGLVLGTIALLGLAATLAAAWRNDSRPRPWDVIEADLTASVTTLRRAFLLALGAGVVVFLLDPLLGGLADVSSVLDVGLELAAIAIATVLAFLAIEGTGTWLTLTLGRRRAEGDRRDRRQAMDRVLAHLDQDLEDAQEASP